MTNGLRSKTDVAMVNESPCKVLCHNVCCVIQAIYELGITAKFWQEPTEPSPLPTPFAEANDSAVADGYEVGEDVPVEAWV